MARTPAWAQRLIEEVARAHGRDFTPVVNWRRAGVRSYWGVRPFESSGRADAPHIRAAYHYYAIEGHVWEYIQETPGQITITAGTSRMDAKLVVLHELAHWLQPSDTGHSPAFWDKAWELYRQYNIPIRYARAREESYRKGSVTAYKRSLAAAKRATK